MKKLLILLALVAALTLTLTACGGDADEPDQEVSDAQEVLPEDADPAEDETEAQEPEEENPADDEAGGDQADEKDQDKDKDKDAAKGDTTTTQKPAQTQKPSQSQKPADQPSQSQPQQPADQPSQASTVGQTLKAAFQADHSGTPLDVAERMNSNAIIPFAPAAEPIQPGLLNGFGNTEITGFSDGACFGPIIGTIPFIGYVFTLDSGTDGAAFCQTLKNAANLRWNVCTEADEMVVAQAGDKVFFLMCPSQFED